MWLSSLQAQQFSLRQLLLQNEVIIFMVCSAQLQLRMGITTLVLCSGMHSKCSIYNFLLDFKPSFGQKTVKIENRFLTLRHFSRKVAVSANKTIQFLSDGI